MTDTECFIHPSRGLIYIKDLDKKTYTLLDKGEFVEFENDTYDLFSDSMSCIDDIISSTLSEERKRSKRKLLKIAENNIDLSSKCEKRDLNKARKYLAASIVIGKVANTEVIPKEGILY